MLRAYDTPSLESQHGGVEHGAVEYVCREAHLHIGVYSDLEGSRIPQIG